MRSKIKTVLDKSLILSLQVWRVIKKTIQQLTLWFRANQQPIKTKLLIYSRLIRLDKPIGTCLLLWPTLWALWIAAEGFPDIKILTVFCLGVFFMRSAGCALNDIADRHYDPMIRRTRDRPLASGQISPLEALYVALSLIIIAFLLVLTMNVLTIQLAFIAVILASIYPFMKRYTYLPQFFLGLTFGWSIPMAFAAQTGTVPKIAWILLIANILWSVVYDTIYAMIDREDDRNAGIKSTAILFDDADLFIIGIIQSLVLITLIIVGKQLQLSIAYYLGVIISACFFIYQLNLIQSRAPKHCMQAFKNNNWFGLSIFTGICLHYSL